MRKWIDFYLKNKQSFINQLIKWGDTKNPFIVLNSNKDALTVKDPYAKYDLVAAAGLYKYVSSCDKGCFEQLKKFIAENRDWIFGYFSYDLKNEIENLNSDNFDGLNFPGLYFFIPQYVFLIKGDKLDIGYLTQFECGTSVAPLFYEIETFQNQEKTFKHQFIEIKSRIDKDKYLQTVNQIKSHIQKGDIYEANFCMEFFSEDVAIAPVDIYMHLNKISPTPFSVYFKQNDFYLMSASPERFLCKRAEKIISQPIKGTAKRSENENTDKVLKEMLENNEKERAENVMIVDLVRNDLSKIAQSGSVRVEELCKVYSFEQVHQLISTVSAIHDEGFDFTDIIKSAFPPGSMTGAPKMRAMQIIEQYEETKRGLYSGAVGYITPEQDFDFNVVIRSILYNAANKYLSYIVGSAITFKSDAGNEYEECLLKAKAIEQVLKYEQRV